MTDTVEDEGGLRSRGDAVRPEQREQEGASVSGDAGRVAPEPTTAGPAGFSRDWWDTNRITLVTVGACVAVALVIGAWMWLTSSRGGTLPSSPATRHVAARTVDAALMLRHDRSTDPAAYAPLFESSQVATELASGSKSATDSASPIPEWNAPYVSAASSATVDVVVVWKRSGRFTSWSAATLFKLKRLADRWVISDAENVVGVPPDPLGRR